MIHSVSHIHQNAIVHAAKAGAVALDRASSLLHAALVATHDATVAVVQPALPALPNPSSFLGYPDVWTFLHDWLPILFMGLLVVAVLGLMRFMPKTKPEEIKPEASPPIGWDDIAGSEDAKAELREVVDYLRDRKRFRDLGARVPKGILLHGPPGTGKTLLAKAVAPESGATFYSQSAASFIEMFAGLGAARIRRLFRIARKHAPAIIFIDELDAVGGHRGMDISGERDQTLNQLLVELDGFNSHDEVVVIAASNLLEKLDTALLRPGRFDRQIFVSPPNVSGRERILEVHSRNKPLSSDVDLALVARQTAGLTGADLANICNEAAIFAARRDASSVAMVDFDSALERVVAGMQSRRTLTEHEKRVVAFHEAGHALCGELLSSVDRVHRISIVPRGRALGYTLNLPEEDRHLKTREELIDFMTMLLGGRAAEQIVFGSVTTGASDDLKRVSEIAHAMVNDYAMGTGFTSMRLVEGSSEATRRVSDEEIHQLADEAYRGARAIIERHRAQLDELALTLLANEVLERADIDKVMVGVPHAAPHRIGRGEIGIAAMKPGSQAHEAR
ncbi:MAG: ATP-dependent metallopeptidase FtsH/Yme1/Tma family protein [Solirubrobacteraceae bacterium]